MENKITFGYWGIRGLGQVSRLLLAYGGLDWTDHQYKQRQKWFNQDKNSLGFHFPNLPYLIDGEFKLTQSRAINYYIIKKSGKNELFGKDIKDQATVECILGVIQDIRTPFNPLFWDAEHDLKLHSVIQKITPKFDELAKFYGDKQYALGYLTLVDFQISELANYVQKLSPDTFNKHQFLKKVREAVNNLPQIQKYYQSPNAMKGPFLPPNAAVPF